MEPKFQSSFIPKTPVTPSSPVVSRTPVVGISILPLIGNIFFVLMLVAYGGLFAYEKILISKISELTDSLNLIKKDLNSEVVSELVTASQQIQSAKQLLHKHVAVSNMFAILESKLLPSVRFNSFAFAENPDGTIKVTASGEAGSYGIIGEQSSIFSEISYLKDSKFPTLDLSDKGAITLRFETNVDQNLVSYSEAIKNMTSSVNTNTQINTMPVMPSSVSTSTRR